MRGGGGGGALVCIWVLWYMKMTRREGGGSRAGALEGGSSYETNGLGLGYRADGKRTSSLGIYLRKYELM